MKFKQFIILTIVLIGFSTINLNAQNKEYLKGLTEATKKEVATKQIMLDGESIPFYNDKGNRVRGNEIKEVMMSGNYTPDFYKDKNGEIKAIVARLATEEEKKMMQKMQTQMAGISELIGTNAPIFSATDINGNEYSLDNLKGKIIVMNFWFVECKPCVMEMPELNKLVEKYINKDVVFIGFANNDKSKIVSFLKKKSFSYNIISNSINIAAEYNVSAYPTHIIIDENSKIAFLTSGLGSTTIIDIEKTIESLIKE